VIEAFHLLAARLQILGMTSAASGMLISKRPMVRGQKCRAGEKSFAHFQCSGRANR
jgi:hypothetical protein